MRPSWLTGLWILMGCSSDLPCSVCPPVEGTWAIVYTTQAETTCGTPDPPRLLALSRVGASLSSQVDDLHLGGTLYDSYQYSLQGVGPSNAGTLSLLVTGVYVPQGHGPDAGAWLRGSYLATLRRGGGSCSRSWNYQAERAP